MATEQSEKLIEELVEYGVRVIRYCEGSEAPTSVKDQLIRSATSIGANFSEAQDASSKKDFANKIYIAKKEASEAKYWLKVMALLDLNELRTQPLIDEAQKYLMILQKIVNTMRNGNS